jgi:hypothetical protein
MALTLGSSMRSAIANAVDSRIGTAATLEFQTSGSAEVATLTLGNPAFGTAPDPTAGVITLTGVPLSDTDATGGTMEKFVIKRDGSSIEITGTVGLSGSDINFLDSVTVAAGDTVILTSLTITCPASS